MRARICCSNNPGVIPIIKERRPVSPVEVITSVERRRRWSAAQKRAMVEEAEQPGNSVSSVAHKYDVHPNQLFQ
jgi:transposase